MRAHDDEVGADLGGELDDLAHGVAAAQVDSDGHATQACRRHGLVVDVQTQVGDKLLRLLGARLVMKHVYQVDLAPRDAHGGAPGQIEGGPVGVREVETGDDAEAPLRRVRQAGGGCGGGG